MSETHLGVLGSPIGHSLSPRIHTAAYAALGLPWAYTAVECGEADLPGFISSTLWRGMSLTMPLKRVAYDLASWRDPVAEASGVVNTLVRVADASPAVWHGYNTDVAGLVRAIREAESGPFERIEVLGAGATAVSAVLAAAELGALTVLVRARDVSKAVPLIELGEQHGVRVVPTSLRDGEWDDSSHLVISTIPGSSAAALDIPPAVRSSVPLYDVAYDPWPSPLASAWVAAGGRVHSGVTMLLHQALVQIRIFTTGSDTEPLTREGDVLAAMRAALPAHTLG